MYGNSTVATTVATRDHHTPAAAYELRATEIMTCGEFTIWTIYKYGLQPIKPWGELFERER